MKKLFTKEAKIGIAFVFTLIILYVGINFLKGINIFKPSNSYTILFEDVTGLTLSSPVLMNGYQIGLVHSMRLDENENNKVAVVVNLNKGIKISKGSSVKLDVSLMGSASIIIESNMASTDYYTVDDKIPGIRNLGMVESLGQSVLPGVGGLVPKLDSILSGVQFLVNNPDLIKSLENINTITANLSVATKQMNQLISVMNRDIPKLTNNMNTMSSDLVSVSGQFRSMDFVKTFNSLDSTMQNVQTLTYKLNSKENSLGLLLNDKALYDSLNQTVGSAGLLLKDVRENPSKYINVKVF